MTKTPKTFDPLDIKIGSNLHQIRTARGVSLQALGNSIGFTYQQIQKYEKGQNRVAAATLVRMAIALDAHISDFMAGIEGIDAQSQPTVSHLNNYLTQINAKSPHVGQRLAALAQAMADSSYRKVG